jgi:hypothetical protein
MISNITHTCLLTRSRTNHKEVIMRKLSQILAVGVMTLTPLMAGGSAFALGSCSIGYTGPDSLNKCTATTTYACTVENNNMIKVTNDNFQFAVTGNTGVDQNTTGGSSASGSATNSNGVTYNATVTNGTCVAVATVPATETPVVPVTPAAPVTVQPVPAPQGQGRGAAVGVLPNTSADSTLAYVAGLVGILGAGVVLSRLVVLVYSRVKL